MILKIKLIKFSFTTTPLTTQMVSFQRLWLWGLVGGKKHYHGVYSSLIHFLNENKGKTVYVSDKPRFCYAEVSLTLQYDAILIRVYKHKLERTIMVCPDYYYKYFKTIKPLYIRVI